jgi:hypothetical protein
MDLRPAIPVAVDVDTNRVYIDERNGERIMAYEHVYTEYDVGRVRQGYCCIHCGEAQVSSVEKRIRCGECYRVTGKEVFHEAPFPEHCFACAFPMRDKQLAQFAEEFEGYTTIGPSRSLAELREEDEEAKEKARRQREGKPTSQIWVPS